MYAIHGSWQKYRVFLSNRTTWLMKCKTLSLIISKQNKLLKSSWYFYFMSSCLEKHLVACIIINNDHIGNVLRANPYSWPVRCLHNVCLKEFQILHNIVICDVNGYWDGQCRRGRVISISEGSLMKGDIIARHTWKVFSICRFITVEGK